jgi:hypothetical protein
MKKVFLSMLLTIGVFGLALGQQSSQSSSSSQDKDKGWEKIGEKTVNLSEDHGIFNWNTDREKTVNADEKYSAIKFKAKDAPVSLTKVEVQYDNGKKQDLSLNTPISTGSESKVLPLDSQEKLDKVTFSFNKDESAQADKAKVEIWGLKANASGMGQGNRSNDIDSRSMDQSKRSMDIDSHSKDIDRDTSTLHSR